MLIPGQCAVLAMKCTNKDFGAWHHPWHHTCPQNPFAPTNDAFAALPAGTVDNLLKPENKAMLTKALTYHVVAGNMDAATIGKAIKNGKGTAELTTVAGGKLWAMMSGKDVVVKDEKGNVAKVTISDVRQSNGVIHVVDKVLLPGM